LGLSPRTDSGRAGSPLLRRARASSLWAVSFEGCGCPPGLLDAVEEELRLRPAAGGAASPRHADLLVVAGRVSLRMLPVLQRIYRQMPEPRWCLAVGTDRTDDPVDTYALIPDLARHLPIDLAIPVYPPTHEALVTGVERLRERIAGGGAGGTP